jgi:hypothetical protein
MLPISTELKFLAAKIKLLLKYILLVDKLLVLNVD